MSETPPPLGRARKFVILAVVFVILGMWAGLTFYSLSVFIDELTKDNHFTITLVSLAVTLSSFAGGIGGVLVARLLRRFSLRLILITGAFTGAVSIASIGFAADPLQLCLTFVGMGFSLAAIGFVPCSDLLARAYHPSPSRAITIGSTGLSFGGAVIPPAVHAIVTALGFSNALIVLGVGLFVIVVTGSLLIKEPPRTGRSSRTPRSHARDSSGSVVNSPIWRRIERLRMPEMPRGVGMLMLAFGLLIFSQGSSITHLLRIAREAGIVDGAVLLSVIAVVSIITRFSGMFILARVRLLPFSLGVVVVQIIALVVFATAQDMPGLVIGSIGMGISTGNLIVLSSLFVLAGFPLSDYASINAVVGLGTTVGAGLGPLFLGAMAGWLGSYSIPLCMLAVGATLGGIALWRTGIDSDPRTARL